MIHVDSKKCFLIQIFRKVLNSQKKKYSIGFGIATNVKELIKEDIHNTRFYFKFTETTASQVKKQYNGYILYWSKLHDQVSSSYYASLFVGHYSFGNLVDYFYCFKNDLQLDAAYLLQLGMNGPNVNKSFKKNFLKA